MSNTPNNEVSLDALLFKVFSHQKEVSNTVDLLVKELIRVSEESKALKTELESFRGPKKD